MTEQEQRIDDIIVELQSMNETSTELKEVASTEKPQIVKPKKEPKAQLTSKEKAFYKNVSQELLSETSTIIEQQIETIRLMDKMRQVFTGTMNTIKNATSTAISAVTSVFHLPNGPLEWFDKILSFVLLIEGLFIVFNTNFGQRIRETLSSITDAIWGSIQFLSDNVQLPEELVKELKGKKDIWDKVEVVYNKVRLYYLKFKTKLNAFVDTISTLFSKVFDEGLDISGLILNLTTKLLSIVLQCTIGYFWDSVKYFGLSVLESIYGGYGDKDKGTPPPNRKNGKIPPTEINSEARKAMQRGNRKEAIDIITSSTADNGEQQLIDGFSELLIHNISPDFKEQFVKKTRGGTHLSVPKDVKYDAGNKYVQDLVENLNKSLVKGQVLTFEEFQKQIPSIVLEKYSRSDKKEAALKQMYEGYLKMAEANKARRNITGYNANEYIEDEANAVLNQYTVNTQVRQFITDSEVDIYQGNYNAGTVVDRELEALSQGNLSLKTYLEETILYFINPDNWLFIQDTMILSFKENFNKFMSDTSVGDSLVVKQFLGEENTTKVNNIRAINPAGRNELSAACRTVEATEEKLEYELMRQKTLLWQLKETYQTFRYTFNSIE